MRFEALLSRADDFTLQELLGRPAVRLIRLLAGEGMSMEMLRTALLSLRSPAELLQARPSRTQLLELLKPDEAARLATLMGVAATDPYASLGTLLLKRGSEREKDFLEFFGVPVPPRLEVEPLPAVASANTRYPLFPHQRRAARDIRVRLSQDPRRVLLHMPTGAGKTRTAMNLVSDHLRAHEPSLVVWLAASEELCEQAAQEFLSAWLALGNRNTHLHRFWGAHDFDPSLARDGLVVAGLPKLFSAAKGSISFIDALRVHTSLVVMDEAHQAVAATYSTLLDALLAASDTTALLGLTATPGRTWNDPEEDEKLSKYFARQKVTLTIDGYDNPIRYLVDEGYLAEPTFSPVLYKPGTELTPQDLASLRRHFDIPDAVLAKLETDEQRNLAILKRTEELTKRHKRVLLFAASVDHAALIASVLRARGTNAVTVTAATPTDERARLIAAFKQDSDTSTVLCNFGVLTTGFDAPRTSAAIIARPTLSLVLYNQMVGRAIRGPRAGGNRTAEVCIVQDPQLPGFGDIAAAFINWEDVWNHDKV